MPIGTCDPATRGDAWNETALSLFEGRVTISYLWGWDGVSVRPDCIGPLHTLRLINTTTDRTFYAWFLSRKGRAQSFTITPGMDQTFTAAELAQGNFHTNEDVDGGMTITESNQSPFQTGKTGRG